MPAVEDVLFSEPWRSGAAEAREERGGSEKLKVFAVPYSEHSSFRELTMFCCGVEVGRIVPTVGVGSRKKRDEMGAWVEKWERWRRTGIFTVGDGGGGGAGKGVW